MRMLPTGQVFGICVQNICQLDQTQWIWGRQIVFPLADSLTADSHTLRKLALR